MFSVEKIDSVKIIGGNGFCKTLNICCIKILRFNENDILAEINFGGHEYHISRK